MSRWFLCFMIYSFFGYCLEKVFAYVSRSDRQVRKCFLLLPLCPVYGLAMSVVISVADAFQSYFTLALAGGIICTAAEYAVHLFYDRIFRVQFWDYSALPGNVRGRICPQFSLIWGILSAAAVRFIHPAVAELTEGFSPASVFLLWMVLAIDCVLTASLLLRFHDTDLLSLGGVLLSSVSPANPEHPDRRTGGSSR